MPRHVVEIISSSLNEHQKSLKGSKILIIGVAYKKNINDFRVSSVGHNPDFGEI